MVLLKKAGLERTDFVGTSMGDLSVSQGEEVVWIYAQEEAVECVDSKGVGCL